MSMTGKDSPAVRARLQDMDKQVEERCRKMQKLIDDHVEEMRNQFARDTLPIPKKVRTMKLATFLAEYKGDLSSVLPKPRRNAARTRGSSVSKYSTPSKFAAGEEETPSRRRSLRLQTPSTVRRRKLGEITYSQNGSPIEDDSGIPASSMKPKVLVMLDEENSAHMNLLLKDDDTDTATHIDVSNEEDIKLLKKKGQHEKAIMMVREYKKKMQAYCDEIMRKMEADV